MEVPKETSPTIATGPRLVIAGHVDSGKSSLLGALASGLPDLADGDRRALVLTHAHESEHGQTSDLMQVPIAFDAAAPAASLIKAPRAKNIRDIYTAQNSSPALVSRLSILDVPGHEDYLRTAIRGIMSSNPVAACLTIDSTRGLETMAKEHLGILMSLRLPLIICMTKYDRASTDAGKPTAELKARLLDLGRTLKSLNRRLLRVTDSTNTDTLTKTIFSTALVPVFMVSVRTWHGMPRLINYLQYLSQTEKVARPRDEFKDSIATPGVPIMATIDHVKPTKAFGYVQTGRVSAASAAGGIDIGKTYSLGPYPDGSYHPVTIRSLQIGHEPVTNAPIDSAFGMVTSVPKSAPRVHRRRGKTRTGCPFSKRGMVLVPAGEVGPAIRCLLVEVMILHSQTTITVGYSPHVHVGGVTRNMRAVSVQNLESGKDGTEVRTAIDYFGDDVLRLGDHGAIRFDLEGIPECIEVGSPLVFTEGRARGVGRVIAVWNEPDPRAKMMDDERKAERAEARTERRRAKRERQKEKRGGGRNRGIRDILSAAALVGASAGTSAGADLGIDDV